MIVIQPPAAPLGHRLSSGPPMAIDRLRHLFDASTFLLISRLLLLFDDDMRMRRPLGARYFHEAMPLGEADITI